MINLQGSCFYTKFYILQELTPVRKKAQETYMQKLSASNRHKLYKHVVTELALIKRDLEDGKATNFVVQFRFCLLTPNTKKISFLQNTPKRKLLTNLQNICRPVHSKTSDVSKYLWSRDHITLQEPD